MEVTPEETMETEELVEGEWAPDPNEPRYCLCNQVSYGDMVACDNPDVRAIFYLDHNDTNSCTLMTFVLTVPSRVVPLRLRRHYSPSQREVVLPPLRYVNETKREEAVKHVDCFLYLEFLY